MKSTFLALSLFFVTLPLISQVDSSDYEDTNQEEEEKSNKDTEDETTDKPTNSLFTKENLIIGLEFMPILNSNALGVELAPFVGLDIKNIFWAGIGATGAVMQVSNGNTTKTLNAFGPHAFARLNILQSYFLQVEYRVLNVEYEPSVFVYKRKWVQSPIIGFGYQYGDNFWLNIGYAVNNEFKSTNPFGALTYRLGVRFK